MLSGGRDTGSALMLMPAAVLVLLILGAVMVDSAVMFLAQRELTNRAAAAANDAATRAIDDNEYYATGRVCLDDETARRVVALAFAPERRPTSIGGIAVDTDVAGSTVTVVARGSVPLVFAPAIPGVASTGSVTGRARAVARGSTVC